MLKNCEKNNKIIVKNENIWYDKLDMFKKQGGMITLASSSYLQYEFHSYWMGEWPRIDKRDSVFISSKKQGGRLSYGQ